MTSIATRVQSFSHLIAAAAVLILLPALHEPALAKSPGAVRPPIPSADELKKLPPDGGPKWNRLVFEKSLYLLQHAANPVDWYPWGEEAFEKARREDKPVFLSIGYSTCHWCHVMEHESFEDPEAAKLINDIFVPVKVDREERPDVDQVYMAVTQAMTGSGGWPTTVLLTPDRKPFFAGTYFPKEGRFGRPGLMELLPAVAKAWKEDRSEVLATADRATSAVTVMLSAGNSDEDLTSDTLARAYSQLASRFDPEHGGFGQAPKFPTPHQLSFLLRYWKRTGETHALHMVETTLQQMRRGGIFDQVGYGFHRYSTDAEWLLPHFEKMLYDQALLAMAYVDAYQATGKPEYAQTAREIFEYVQRDLQGEEEAFYSAEDADSEGEEGKFYVWTTEEVRSVLGDEEADLYIRAYGLEKEGNFRDEATGEKSGANIPHLDAPLTSVAAELQLEESAFRQRLETARKKLFAARAKRIRPHLDDKILTDWNGLMIAALARGAKGLVEEQYAQSARRAADFLLAELQTTGGELLKRYRKGDAGLPALLDDYAFFVWGLLELYEATFDVRYLHEAVRLNDVMIGRFWDESSGGFFLPPESATDLLVRGKEIYDGAIPSGNSVAALNLLKLGRITGRSEYEQKAEALMRAFAGSVKSSPAAHTQLMTALDWAVGPTREVVIAGDEQSSATRDMAQAVRAAFLPRTILLHRPPGDAPPITGIAPFTAAQKMQQDKTTGYVCRNYACEQPVFATEDLREALER